MARFYRTRFKRSGASPGTLVESVDRAVAPPTLSLFVYDAQQFHTSKPESLADIKLPADEALVTWLHIEGFPDRTLLEEIGDRLGIHALVLEDIQSLTQRPKIEIHEGYAYIAVRLFSSMGRDTVQSEQLSLLVGRRFVLTFQEVPGERFRVVQERLRTNDSRLRKRGADYLAYRLLDTVVDHYFDVVEDVGQRLETVEQELMDGPGQSTLAAIYRLKRELLFLRKSIWPVRELVGVMLRDETEWIQTATRVFLRDVQDHAIQVGESLDALRDVASGMLDTYLSLASNRMNEVMKVLTIIATIFIPLTFIAGVYGMNFRYMPELEWPWGYAAVWLVMLVIGGAMVVFFKKKKWL